MQFSYCFGYAKIVLKPEFCVTYTNARLKKCCVEINAIKCIMAFSLLHRILTLHSFHIGIPYAWLVRPR